MQRGAGALKQGAQEIRGIEGIEVRGPMVEGFQDILTPEALQFVARLQRSFGPMRESLLRRRRELQLRLDEGWTPEFPKATEELRRSQWKVRAAPADLQDRRVEITGPVDRKMIINALNSGANVFMADFEDSHSPTWSGTIQGQLNLRDAVNRRISFTSAEGKEYRLNERTAVLMARPRGWHLTEKHVVIDGKPVSASLFDFGLYFFHNAKTLAAQGSGPYFYLPKLENALEARLWNDVFVFAQKELGLAVGTIRATVLIETILAAFEMDEILYELRDHITGLNCGRWDYIFSFIKKFRNHSEYVLPERAQVKMDSSFLKAYSLLLIRTCHRRGAHAMGGMAAQIPIRHDPAANAIAISRVEEDKEREVTFGHDGTWVAHPGLVPVAKRIFDRVMTGENQLHITREDCDIRSLDLLTPHPGDISEEGFRNNIGVSLRYLASWLNGQGCVPINNLMEDAATVEISRAQIWQWMHHSHRGILRDGRPVTAALYRKFREEEVDAIHAGSGAHAGHHKLSIAAELLDHVILNDEFVEFITLPAYEHLE